MRVEPTFNQRFTQLLLVTKPDRNGSRAGKSVKPEHQALYAVERQGAAPFIRM
jgi:hypothetical protein